MKLSNCRTEIVSLNPFKDEQEFGWVNLRVSGTDPVTQATPQLQVAIPLTYATEWSIEEVREKAILETMDLLESVVSHYYRESR